MRRLALTVLAAIAVAGCSSDPPSITTTQAVGSAAPSASETPTTPASSASAPPVAASALAPSTSAVAATACRATANGPEPMTFPCAHTVQACNEAWLTVAMNANSGWTFQTLNEITTAQATALQGVPGDVHDLALSGSFDLATANAMVKACRANRQMPSIDPSVSS